MLTKSTTKVAPKFLCATCDYSTSRKHNFDKHKTTLKHEMLTNANKSSTKVAQNPASLICSDCGKAYKHRTSLSRHKRNCEPVTDNLVLVQKEELADYQAKAELFEEQREKKCHDLEARVNELQALVKRATDTGAATTINNNLNINIILETKCKNAMNITDFVAQLQLTLEDLSYTKQNGYIEGMSNIFIKNLQELEPAERPIHCADKKGTSLYIKDDGQWEKDGDGMMLNAQIGVVTKKHIDALKAWEESHPSWQSSEMETKTYVELVQKIMGSSDDAERIKNHKLIQRKIGKTFNIGDVAAS